MIRIKNYTTLDKQFRKDYCTALKKGYFIGIKLPYSYDRIEISPDSVVIIKGKNKIHLTDTSVVCSLTFSKEIYRFTVFTFDIDTKEEWFTPSKEDYQGVGKCLKDAMNVARNVCEENQEWKIMIWEDNTKEIIHTYRGTKKGRYLIKH